MREIEGVEGRALCAQARWDLGAFDRQSFLVSWLWEGCSRGYTTCGRLAGFPVNPRRHLTSTMSLTV